MIEFLVGDSLTGVGTTLGFFIGFIIGLRIRRGMR